MSTYTGDHATTTTTTAQVDTEAEDTAPAYLVDTTATTYTLANDADVACPDSLTSEGAEFLASVRDALAERIEHDAEDVAKNEGDVCAEIADGAVPVWNTHRLMTAYVDLAAYREDLSDYGDTVDGVTLATWSLHQVGQRLASTLLDQWRTDPEISAESAA
ncbi:hypothetical protein AFL01nite_05170 [Aeromicrobium flavum]|uniref:Uncharacterized protein n=1 Tax=Aeromicrobium flavum TaxID=416568 RepID=A0A512HS29_9ACTN|nr:hypothetical protein [Aeromicrobium flavum]GEO88190.1 hypothetical protein AFL01nite_05170 [Aeromicrobium flavum]